MIYENVYSINYIDPLITDPITKFNHLHIQRKGTCVLYVF